MDPALDGVVVVFNATPHEISQRVDALVDRFLVLSEVQVCGVDPVVRETRFDATTGLVTVPARTVAVLIQEQAGRGEAAPRRPISFENFDLVGGFSAPARN